MLKNIFLWTAALFFAAISFSAALGSIAKEKDPELAVALFPANGFATENLASAPVKQVLAENQGQFPDPSEIDPKQIKLAEQAFLAEPATPQAIAVLAVGGADNNRSELMKAAQSLSRREQLVTGWMIINSGSRGDVPGILKSYDTLLRTSSSAGSVVIPVMANALANDNFINPFADLLSNRPPWAGSFWANVVASPNALVNAARLRQALHRSEIPDDVYRDPQLITALVKNEQYEQAQDLYFFLDGQKSGRSPSVNMSFRKEAEYPPFDWQLYSTGEYGAVLNDGKLQMSAIRGSGGLFARQLIKLPGKAIMDVTLDGEISSEAKMFITLSCAQAMQAAPQPIRIPLKGEIDNLQINNAQSGCNFYWFDVSGRASENGDGFDIALDSVSIQ